MKHFPTALLDRAAAAPMLERMIGWCDIASGSRDLAGLARIGAALHRAFSTLPGTVRLVEGTAVTDLHGAPVAHGRALHAVIRPDAPVQLLLTGHMDTVYGPEAGFTETRPIGEGRLNGPGVADMKGGLAVMLAALEAFEAAAPDRSRLGYEVVIGADEEVGSPASAALLAAAARGKRAALTYEPALEDGTLAGARPGSGNFACIVSGRAAHAGRDPDAGRNALVAAADLALRLSRAAGPRLSVNPARIDGGGPNNVVPDHAILHVNMRPATLPDMARAQSALDAAVAMVAAEHDVAIRVHGSFGRPPKPMDAAAERLFGLVRDCGAELGLPIDWRSTGGVCDGNNIAAAGVPVVDTMGVRGGAIHSRDEYMVVESLAERARLSALVLHRLADGALA